MGIQILKSRFRRGDFLAFGRRLQAETELLDKWFKTRRFDRRTRAIGIELETCLVDQRFDPAPKNETLLRKIRNPQVVPELSKFNVEINATPQELGGDCLKKMHRDLKRTWKEVQKACAALKLHMLMVGCLPTLEDEMLTLKYMSNNDRYRALNAEVMSLRQGIPIRIHIQGYDTLDVTHQDVMLEAATTSMQIHLQVEADKISRYFNAAMIASAPMVAVSANSPFLFGKSLWEETRVPVFERAVMTPGFAGKNGSLPARVGFGSGFTRKSLYEVFRENLEFPVLLPLHFSKKKEEFCHVRLQNGTIWRWNRPVLGIDSQSKPHLRVEHRVCPAGPTITDMVANMAFFLGMVQVWATQKIPPESRFSFDDVKENFYAASHWGLSSTVKGFHPKERHLQTLLLRRLIPMAKKGLKALKIDRDDIRFYLDEILVPRVKTARTGSAWQRGFIHHHGPDFRALTEAYFHLQEKDLPVHEWKL